MRKKEFKNFILSKMKEIPYNCRVYVGSDLEIKGACPFLLVGKYRGFSVTWMKPYEFIKFYCGGILIPDMNPIRTSVPIRYVMEVCVKEGCPLIKSWKEK